ncbi:copper amine oxidase N-terminal domain-containing protein [Lysinibacillus piscis]|uniref:Copper amine oxidase-like N-terminal domain-containing protein n=1 Tax=Lysinibacillus piscis TaxID=2518931 RepID=A0ABQ5NKF3_9BACI|nr:copper amine oxidase N-terminal domain-containing protein [Lysinibacillus sp. KH24]GLC88841.1 hypothetical protein LYSBPC_19680 [Lysinibacillus sp. KH24]
MNYTKMIPFVLAAVVVSGSVPSVVSAQESEVAVTVKEQQEPIFFKITGTIEKMESNENEIHYTVKTDKTIHVFIGHPNTLIFDNTGQKVELQKGDQITGYTLTKNATHPEVIIVETEAVGNVEVDFFNQDLVDTDHFLKLIIGEQIEVSHASGKKVKAATFESVLANHYLLVFYTVSTRSIPAQTAPTKVVVLDTIEQKPINNQVQAIIDTDFYEVEGTKMVPLRLIAEQLGYKVESTGQGAIVSKDAVSYTITRDQKAYGYNKTLRMFTIAPALLEKGKTYVPVEFIKGLMQE